MTNWRPRDLDRTIQNLEKQCSNLINHRFPCAVIYATKAGVLKGFGDQTILNVVKEHGKEITNGWAEEATSESKNQEENSNREMVCLPDLPGNVEGLNYHTLRKLVIAMCQIESGAGQIGWGREETRPEWWPEGIRWSAFGVQKGVSVQQLRELVYAGYSYYGHEIEQVIEPPVEEPAELPVDSPVEEMHEAEGVEEPVELPVESPVEEMHEAEGESQEKGTPERNCFSTPITNRPHQDSCLCDTPVGRPNQKKRKRSLDFSGSSKQNPAYRQKPNPEPLPMKRPRKPKTAFTPSTYL